MAVEFTECGINSIGRASVFQTESCEFESHIPLLYRALAQFPGKVRKTPYTLEEKVWSRRHCGSFLRQDFHILNKKSFRVRITHLPDWVIKLLYTTR